jgi:nucleoside-diphosphate-sugar epimerase/glyoxylase-like metal-dependent hydrolase (beta-lactamase superfamily II)
MRYPASTIGMAQAGEITLVTGATGFLGGHLVRRLLREGHRVRALGRNLARGVELCRLGADFRPVDLRDRDSMLAVCQGISTVVHSGALSSPWASYKYYFDINVTGTQNVIDGCLEHNVRRLVHISSPSVMSIHGDQFDLDETSDLPEDFVSHYSKSKALAESRVQQAISSRGLEAVILRPKAIYGAGDNAIIPRIIKAASSGRLPVIGEGRTVTNITYVEDVVNAILLSMETGHASGNTYLITGGEEVDLWEVIHFVVDKLGFGPIRRKVSRSRMMRVAGVLEFLWKVLPLSGEPPVTRYSVSILSYSKTYDISAARKDLGYEPKVPWKEGVERFLNAGDLPSPVSTDGEISICTKPRPIPWKVLSAGSTRAPARFAGAGKGWARTRVPALFGLFDHPEQGPVLFDTGYSTRLYKKPCHGTCRTYSTLLPVSVREEENAVHQLESLGYRAEDVGWIILSHFHADHCAGIRDFPNARVVCSIQGFRELSRSGLGVSMLYRRLIRHLMPEDLAARIFIVPDLPGPSLEKETLVFDLLGDGSIHLVPLGGHSAGMLGVWATGPDGATAFFVGDAVWSREQINHPPARFSPHRLIAHDRKAQEHVYQFLSQVKKNRPDVLIVPSHCHEAEGKLVTGSSREKEG